MNCHSWKSLLGLVLTAGMGLVLPGDEAALRAQAPPMQAPPPMATQAPPAQRFSADQLDDLVAPIALYSDQLLSQILVATTYPLEVVEAQQWLQRNNTMSGQQLLDAARQQNWDPSVQALVAFPDVLGRLNQDVRWTTDLGNAFLAQQPDVMSAVQRMRARAQANGRLSSTPQETVTTQTQGGQSAIQIQPADPQVMYVPNYDPAYIWGPPAWGYYPSLYYPAFGFGFWPGINIGLYFGGWGGWGFGGWGWGWGPNWFGHSIFINHGFFNHYGFAGSFGRGFGGAGFAGRSVWTHDAGHRLGVPYSNGQLAGRYGAASMASRATRFGAQSSYNRSLGASRSGFQAASRQGASTFSANRSGYGSRQGFSGSQGSSGSRQGFSGSQGYRGSNYQSRSFQSSGSGARSYGGGNARSYSAPAARSYGGSSARSYGGGSSHSFSSGGARSSGGGGGGGFHGGGGGGHSGGGGHGRR
jgi:hypothetical protein